MSARQAQGAQENDDGRDGGENQQRRRGDVVYRVVVHDGRRRRERSLAIVTQRPSPPSGVVALSPPRPAQREPTAHACDSEKVRWEDRASRQCRRSGVSTVATGMLAREVAARENSWDWGVEERQAAAPSAGSQVISMPWPMDPLGGLVAQDGCGPKRAHKTHSHSSAIPGDATLAFSWAPG